MKTGSTRRSAWGAALIAFAALPAAPAAAGTDDLGSAGGIHYRARSAPPIASGGVSIGPDAECSPGDQLVGGGVAIGGDFAESLISRSSSGDMSLSSPQSWVAIWSNVAGGPKSATVSAACMDRHVVRVRKTKQVAGGRTRRLNAFCPAGTSASSGGGFIGSGYLNSSYPVDDGDRGHVPADGWRLRVRNTSMATQEATVEARCVDFHPRYRVSGPVSIDDGATIDARAGCRGSSHVIGGGLRLGGAGAEAHPVTMTLEDGGDTDAVPDDRFAVRAGNASGTEHKPMTVFATCKG
jgi:hypothetical protein